MSLWEKIEPDFEAFLIEMGPNYPADPGTREMYRRCFAGGWRARDRRSWRQWLGAWIDRR